MVSQYILMAEGWRLCKSMTKSSTCLSFAVLMHLIINWFSCLFHDIIHPSPTWLASLSSAVNFTMYRQYHHVHTKCAKYFNFLLCITDYRCFCPIPRSCKIDTFVLNCFQLIIIGIILLKAVISKADSFRYAFLIIQASVPYVALGLTSVSIRHFFICRLNG